MNLCPRGFCCYVKLDSSYQVSKIAEIIWVNQKGALEKQLDPGWYTGILATEVLLQNKDSKHLLDMLVKRVVFIVGGK